jgi:hypothetical protein
VLLRGTAKELDGVSILRGVDVEDHGQRKLPGGRWELSAYIADEEALKALRGLGVTVTELPALDEEAGVPLGGGGD